MATKILLVDDTRVFLDVEKAIFTRTGAVLLTASSGTEALKLALAENPDIMLLDLVLPDIPGDRICEQMKKNPRTARIPVIMVTGRGSADEVERCWRSGCDDFVSKPISQPELLAKVARLLKVPHRQSLRILIRVETSVESSASGKKRVFFGKSVDISVSGMLLEADEALQLAEEVWVRFFLPGQMEIRVSGKVVRKEEAELRKYVYGIQFLQPGHGERHAIEEFIRSRSG